MDRNTIAPIALWSAAILATILVGSYPVGYFCLSEERATGRGIIRVFPNESCARAYHPASKVERWLTGKRVLLGSY